VSNKRPLTPAFPICRYEFADRRRCAQPASPESNGLCYTHAHTPPRPLRRSDLIRELSAPDNAPPDASRIHRFLAKLPRAAAEGLIPASDLRVYHQLCSVMLQAARDIEARKPPKSPSQENILKAQHLIDDEPENDRLSTHPSRP